MTSICGLDCCNNCDKKGDCGGCIRTDGHPFGGDCIAAKYIQKGGFDEFYNAKNALINEINSLNIENLKVQDLNLLNGFYVNLEYKLENGKSIKFLKDNNIYWGNQIEITDSERCYGVVADDRYILVCEYGCNGENSEIVLYKRR